MRKLLATAVTDWKLEHYAKLYGERKITLARAAREAGVSLWEMIDYTRRKKIPSQYDLDDFEDDLEAIRSRLASR
jgi:predicted HTH domain antitoxin